MDDKTKKIIAGLSILAVGGISLGIIYYRYKKINGLGFNEVERLRMPKMIKSRWEHLESQYEKLNNYRVDRGRFTVYDRGDVERRFKVLKTHGNGTGRAGRRLRVSGDIYKKTPSGYNYNRNNRNADFSDLIIP